MPLHFEKFNFCTLVVLAMVLPTSQTISYTIIRPPDLPSLLENIVTPSQIILKNLYI